MVLDGEEEAGSANFRRFAEARPQALKTDLAITLDGPRHPSGRPTVYFGVRGGAGVTITVYGAAGDLHSGNYGNWAPDPSMALAKLLATMKDDQGRVTIQDFYRDVRPLTAAERQALDEAPNVEAVLARDFGVARPERPDTRLEVKLNEPTLSILVMESGGGLGIPGRSAIPATATARLEVRMVKDLVPETQNTLIADHVRRQGYFVVTGRDPSPEERRAHPKIARVDPRGRGSAASRVSMDDPRSQAVVDGADPWRRPAGAAADPRRRPAVRHLQRSVPDADRRRVDRQLRQQPARPRREPAAAEPVGGHRDAGQPHDHAGRTRMHRMRRSAIAVAVTALATRLSRPRPRRRRRHGPSWPRSCASSSSGWPTAAPGVVGIGVVDLSSGERWGVNDTLVFAQGSAIKIPLLIELFRRSDAGELTLTDRKTLDRRRSHRRQQPAAVLLRRRLDVLAARPGGADDRAVGQHRHQHAHRRRRHGQGQRHHGDARVRADEVAAQDDSARGQRPRRGERLDGA